jgi:cellulose synthase operon protein B
MHKSVFLIPLILALFSCGTSPSTGKSLEQSVYSWIVSVQMDNGLLPSTENGPIISLYDNALAAMSFALMGDFPRAGKILDFFTSRIDTELNQAPGGFAQFRDRKGGLPAEGPHRWMGDNAWLLLAVNNYHAMTGSDKYKRLAAALETWLRSLQDGDGGLWGGYDRSGTHIPKITEGMIDAFNAVPGYDAFHSSLLHFLKTSRWDAADRMLISWPSPPHPNYKYALDMCSWGFCSFPDFPVSVLEQADRFLTVKTSAVTGLPVTGYCLDEDRDNVFLEGTGQMAVAFATAGNEVKAGFFLKELEKGMAVSAAHAGLKGLPYTTNGGTTYASTPLWEGAEKLICVSSSAWYLFGRMKFDPFAVGRNKRIPAGDKFWMAE